MTDDDWMQRALDEARAAAAAGEVPVGAVVVKDGALLASGRNTSIAQHDPSGHAEINALRAAAQALGNYRLEDCTLYVTLEPCAMCAGAMLHARLARVVFGAPDPKTGASGSVVDLFAQPLLNHRTVVQGGVCADSCAAELQQFFRARRVLAREQAQPLRDDALRTPDARFADLPDWPWAARYSSDLPTLAGWRLHYIDEGPRDAPLAVVALHGAGQWAYLYRRLVARLAALAGPRVLAPDLIGFGRSDKPKRASVHALEWHAAVIREWIEGLDLPRVLLVHAADDAALAARVGSLLPADRFAGFLPVETQHDAATAAAWSAPFVDAGYQAGLRAWPVKRGAVRDLAQAEADRAAQAAMGYFAP
ncbi:MULTISPECIES: tRNA adenosine(34) deaminase TadA [unclassified Variovorax]|uniref:tRNA adenosine(34) deaminase TadA n=1 Tax=unclassified Variovorax TaxID=663243 RepID=UPI001BD67F4B|nr:MULTISPECIES: tRNA adenosine(34) deaminase TadA [unclassified Variovorax]